jgi:hypothetical protein
MCVSLVGPPVHWRTDDPAFCYGSPSGLSNSTHPLQAGTVARHNESKQTASLLVQIIRLESEVALQSEQVT